MKLALKTIPGVQNALDNFKNNTGEYEQKAIDFLETIEHEEGSAPVIVLVVVDGKLTAVTGAMDDSNCFHQGDLVVNGQACSLFKVQDILNALLKEYGL